MFKMNNMLVGINDKCDIADIKLVSMKIWR